MVNGFTHSTGLHVGPWRKIKNCCNQPSVVEWWLKCLTVFYWVLSGCVCISKEHTACPLGMDFWSEAVVADVWRPMLWSFQGALLQSEFVDWDHGAVHWDPLRLRVSGFSYDATSTPGPPGAFVMCWLAKPCTSIILVNILEYVNEESPCYFQGCKVRTFKGNVKRYGLKVMRPLHKLYVEESGKAAPWRQRHMGWFPFGQSPAQCLWDVQVGQARCSEMESPSSVSQ